MRAVRFAGGGHHCMSLMTTSARSERDVIAEALQAGSGLFSLNKLESQGFKVRFDYDTHPSATIAFITTPSKDEFVAISSKYADDPEIVVNGVAVGRMSTTSVGAGENYCLQCDGFGYLVRPAGGVFRAPTADEDANISTLPLEMTECDACNGEGLVDDYGEPLSWSMSVGPTVDWLDESLDAYRMAINPYQLMPADREKIEEALRWFGYGKYTLQDVDITENGEVWVGLTQILPAGSVVYTDI